MADVHVDVMLQMCHFLTDAKVFFQNIRYQMIMDYGLFAQHCFARGRGSLKNQV